MIRIPLVGLVAALLLAACGSGSDEPADSEPTTSRPSTITMTAQPGATPASTDFSLGEEAKLDDLTAEVLEYKKDVEPRGANDAGFRMDAGLIRMCNDIVTELDDPLTVFTGRNWQLRDDDDGSYEQSNLTYRQGPAPVFPSEREVKVGDCIKGWVVWSVPEDAEMVQVAFVRDGVDVGLWSLDQAQ